MMTMPPLRSQPLPRAERARRRAATRARAIVARVLLLASGTVAAVTACTDFSGAEDPARGLPNTVVAEPSFARDVEPVLVGRCSMGGCHSPGAAQAGLVLARGVAYDSLVNVRARLNPAMQRVRPSDTDSSWLLRMVEADPARRDGFSRMPLLAAPLTDAQLANLVAWVRQGARRN